MTGHTDATANAESVVDDEAVDQAIAAFERGDPVLVHDAADREGEVDLVYPADSVDADAVARLRNDAGGLVCVAVGDAVAESWGIPFLTDALDHPAATGGDLHYDQRSSFSLPVNHRETFTGITDDDRALTITELARAAAATRAAGDGDDDAGYGPEDFAEAFRTPGHVHLLRGAPNLLADRQGHTELALALADATDRAPAVVVCEMLDDESGGALPTATARAYAERHDFVYVEGRDLLTRFA
jgi:3,4-dihydroxy 2-butanone 4-phosphate synthase